jgi:hypothetical protein
MKLPSGKETVILELLCGCRDLFPLDMVRASGELSRSSIYVLLGRMEQQRLVEGRDVKDPGSDLPRRIYRLTGLGQRALNAKRAAQAAFDDGGLKPAGA